MMNKAHFLFFIFAVLLATSCTKKEAKTSAIDLANYNRVSVIIDDELWNGEVGDSIRNYFALPIVGLPQEEPVFTLNQYPVKLMEGYMTNSRNIIVVKKGIKNQFKIVENEYLKPQIVVHIAGKTVKEIIDSLQVNDSVIMAKIKNQETNFFQKELKKDSLQNTKVLLDKFNIVLDIPKKYNLVLKKSRFLWYKKDITSGNLSLIIYQIPITKFNINKFGVENSIETRNAIGKKYIHGAKPNSWMSTEATFSPFFAATKIANHTVFETKGSWELEHDYMNGPFINYGFIDAKHKRIIFVEGFCYAPSKQKRDFMFELEAIIKSIQFKNIKQKI